MGDLLTAVLATNALYYLEKVNAHILKQVSYALCPLLGHPGFEFPSPIGSYRAFACHKLQAVYDCHDVANRRTAFSHWYIVSGPKQRQTITRIPLGALRRLWHNDYPALLLKPSRWQIFWSLSLPSKAFTSW